MTLGQGAERRRVASRRSRDQFGLIAGLQPDVLAAWLSTRTVATAPLGMLNARCLSTRLIRSAAPVCATFAHHVCSCGTASWKNSVAHCTALFYG